MRGLITRSMARLAQMVSVRPVPPGGGRSPIRDARVRASGHSTRDVESYYQHNTPAYLRGFGEFFQGSRPDSDEQLVSYTIEAAQLADGQDVLDAGCGVGGPALAFATHLDLRIEGVTLAPAQVDEARTRIAKAELKGSVAVRQGDFHQLATLYPGRQFDRVLLLESLCHAESYRDVLAGARDLLKPGGKIYIKEFYAVDHRARPERIEAQNTDLKRLTDIYKLVVPDLPSVLDLVSELGFQLVYLRMPEFEPTYRHWAQYEVETGRPWSPHTQPGEVIQGFELLAQI